MSRVRQSKQRAAAPASISVNCDNTDNTPLWENRAGASLKLGHMGQTCDTMWPPMQRDLGALLLSDQT